MTPYFQTDLGKLFNGSALDVLRQLPDESVQCCVTSPPYWGLRDYGVDGQLGLEPTPELYVSHLVQVFREVRRVLRKDGTLFLNLGDSYASGKGSCFNPGGGASSLEGHARLKEAGAYKLNRPNVSDLEVMGLKPKDLVGVPWRVAFALQADGWWLRSDIIWNKPNPMPESVRDRPTKAHEYIFLLTKSERYFWDQEAVKEASTTGDPRKPYCPGQVDHRGSGHDRNGGSIRAFPDAGKYRNIRSVWTLPTIPYAEAHFATFPQSIPERCIKAGTKPIGGENAAVCSLPDRESVLCSGFNGDDHSDAMSVVLDPFFGAGTVGLVAEKLKRRWIGAELNDKYCGLAQARIEKFLWGETEPDQERLFPTQEALF